MRRMAWLWILLIFAPALWAQSPSMISGIVVDGTRAALPRVTVRLLDKTGNEVGKKLTDSDGRFQFERATTGSYRVEASLTGFRPKVVSAAAGSELQIVLEVAPVREYVTVTADRTETPTSLTGATTTVLDQRAIEDRQQVLASSVLQSAPAVMVVRSGGLGTVTSVFVRGGESNYNKILLDGIPLNEPGGTFEFANLAEEDLDRIEIVRGPPIMRWAGHVLKPITRNQTTRFTTQPSQATSVSAWGRTQPRGSFCAETLGESARREQQPLNAPTATPFSVSRTVTPPLRCKTERRHGGIKA